MLDGLGVEEVGVPAIEGGDLSDEEPPTPGAVSVAWEGRDIKRCD
jgi:hypothetical protein